MRTLNGRSFRLPYVPNETFRELMRIGVGYRREDRSYYIRNPSNIDEIRALVSKILEEEVGFTGVSAIPQVDPKICSVCSRQIDCERCRFADECDLKSVESRPQSREDGGKFCLCERCLGDPNVFDKYVKRSIQFIQMQAIRGGA